MPKFFKTLCAAAINSGLGAAMGATSGAVGAKILSASYVDYEPREAAEAAALGGGSLVFC